MTRSDQAPPSTDDRTFAGQRARLLGLAYRLTGSRATAEDLVQEAWLRWDRADRTTIERPPAWLTTVVSRLALDHLASARHQRESYVGPWLPEAVPTDDDPAASAELAESVTIGFLTVLERLGPVERVVFLLADVFGVPFDEIAAVVGRSPEACRQVASRARRRVRDGRPRFAPTDAAAWDVTVAFLGAAQGGDLGGLLSLLADDAVLLSDGGADHRAARRPVLAARIPRFFANLTRRMPPDATARLLTVNGQPGVVLDVDGAPFAAVGFSVVDGRIDRIWVHRNPAKLATVGADPIT